MREQWRTHLIARGVSWHPSRENLYICHFIARGVSWHPFTRKFYAYIHYMLTLLDFFVCLLLYILIFSVREWYHFLVVEYVDFYVLLRYMSEITSKVGWTRFNLDIPKIKFFFKHSNLIPKKKKKKKRDKLEIYSLASCYVFLFIVKGKANRNYYISYIKTERSI